MARVGSNDKDHQSRLYPPFVPSGTPDGLVFGGLPNTSNLCVSLKNWADKAGVKKNVTFHTARHSCAVLLLTLGADIYTVSKILGHRSVRATQVYAKIVDKKKDDAITLVDDAF